MNKLPGVRNPVLAWLATLSLALTSLAAVGCSHLPGADADPNDLGAEPCIDGDGDGFGQNCALGADCDDRDPASTNQCYVCVHDGIEGCPCAEPGQLAACGVQRTSLNRPICGLGNSVCQDGKWSACNVDRFESFFDNNTPAAFPRPATIAIDGGSCADSGIGGAVTAGACDPYCNTFADSLDGGIEAKPDVVGFGDGAVLNEAGITLKQLDAGTSDVPDVVPPTYDASAEACVNVFGNCTHSLCEQGNGLNAFCENPNGGTAPATYPSVPPTQTPTGSATLITATPPNASPLSPTSPIPPNTTPYSSQNTDTFGSCEPRAVSGQNNPPTGGGSAAAPGWGAGTACVAATAETFPGAGCTVDTNLVNAIEAPMASSTAATTKYACPAPYGGLNTTSAVCGRQPLAGPGNPQRVNNPGSTWTSGSFGSPPAGTGGVPNFVAGVASRHYYVGRSDGAGTSAGSADPHVEGANGVLVSQIGGMVFFRQTGAGTLTVTRSSGGTWSTNVVDNVIAVFLRAGEWAAGSGATFTYASPLLANSQCGNTPCVWHGAQFVTNVDGIPGSDAWVGPLGSVSFGYGSCAAGYKYNESGLCCPYVSATTNHDSDGTSRLTTSGTWSCTDGTFGKPGFPKTGPASWPNDNAPTNNCPAGMCCSYLTNCTPDDLGNGRGHPVYDGSSNPPTCKAYGTCIGGNHPPDTNQCSTAAPNATQSNRTYTQVGAWGVDNCNRWVNNVVSFTAPAGDYHYNIGTWSDEGGCFGWVCAGDSNLGVRVTRFNSGGGQTGQWTIDNNANKGWDAVQVWSQNANDRFQVDIHFECDGVVIDSDDHGTLYIDAYTNNCGSAFPIPDNNVYYGWGNNGSNSYGGLDAIINHVEKCAACNADYQQQTIAGANTCCAIRYDQCCGFSCPNLATKGLNWSTSPPKCCDYKSTCGTGQSSTITTAVSAGKAYAKPSPGSQQPPECCVYDACPNAQDVFWENTSTQNSGACYRCNTAGNWTKNGNTCQTYACGGGSLCNGNQCCTTGCPTAPYTTPVPSTNPTKCENRTCAADGTGLNGCNDTRSWVCNPNGAGPITCYVPPNAACTAYVCAQAGYAHCCQSGGSGWDQSCVDYAKANCPSVQGGAVLACNGNGDTDKDGYADSVDCRPCDPLVNPGAFDFTNTVDDDCDGLVDNAQISCDNGVTVGNGKTGEQAMMAMGLCRFVKQGAYVDAGTVEYVPEDASAPPWGVIDYSAASGVPVASSKFVYDASTGADQQAAAPGAVAPPSFNSYTSSSAFRTPATDGYGVWDRFGAATNAYDFPKEGTRLLAISTGAAADRSRATFRSTQIGYERERSSGIPITGKAPGALVAAGTNPSCPKGSSQNDAINLRFQVRVPSNAVGFSFNSQWFTAEYPEWLCSSYNDSFLGVLNTQRRAPDGGLAVPPIPAGSGYSAYPGGNIIFDTNKKPVTVNLASQGGDPRFFPLPGANVNFDHPFLAGTGYDQLVRNSGGVNSYGSQITETGGSTGWLTTTAPVLPGEVITMEFIIWDSSDLIYDSTAIIDNWLWSPRGTPYTAPTTTPDTTIQPATYVPSGTFDRDFTANCPAGTSPSWKTLTWSATTPTAPAQDSSIDIFASSAPTLGELATDPYYRLTQLVFTPVTGISQFATYDGGGDPDSGVSGTDPLTGQLATATASYLRNATPPGVGTCVTPSTCNSYASTQTGQIDLVQALKSLSIPSSNTLRIEFRLNAGTDSMGRFVAAPSLLDWNVQYDCLPM